MSNTPSPSTSPSPPAGGAPEGPRGPGRMIGAVVLAGAVAAGSYYLLQPRSPAPLKPGDAATLSKPEAGKPPAMAKAKGHSESLGDIEISTALGVLKLFDVKTLESSLTKAELEALLRGDASNVARFDAAAITAAKGEWRPKAIKDQASTTVYTDLVARNIRSGVIETLSVASTETTGETGKDKKKFTSHMGKLTLAKLDLPLMNRWYTEADPEGKASFQPLHGRYTIESMKINIDTFEASFGQTSMSETRVRPARRALSQVLAELLKAGEEKTAGEEKNAAQAQPEANKSDGAPQSAAPAEKPAKANDSAVVMALIDVMSSFELGEGSVEAIRFTAPGKTPPETSPPAPGTEKPKPEPVSGALDKITFAGGSASRLGFEGFSLKASEGTMGIARMAMGGDALSMILMGADKALKERAASTDPQDEALRALIKKQVAERKLPDATFSLEGLNGDFAAKSSAPQGERIQFGVKRLAFLLGNFVALTPTRIDYALENIRAPLPKISNDPAIVAMREMGLEQMDLSAHLAAAWEEASQRFTLSDLTVDMDKLARVALSAEAANVPRAFFEDPKRNWPSAMGATINALTIAIDNKGGLAKLVDVAARKQGKTGDNLRNEMAAIAPLVISGMLAGHPDGAKLSQGIADFIKGLDHAKVKITSSGPNGIPIVEFGMAGQNPAAFAQKLRFEVEAR